MKFLLAESRIKNDAIDREKLNERLSTFIDPLDATSHPVGTVNIANGLLSSSNVNVDESFEIGLQQMREFELGWPTNNFHGALKKKVTTLVVNNKSIKIDETPVYDTALIYTRVLGLQQSRNLDIKDVLTYEISAFPQALFNENSDMRTQPKAKLKSKLQVEVSTRHANAPDVIIIDGCAMLWSVHWPVLHQKLFRR